MRARRIRGAGRRLWEELLAVRSAPSFFLTPAYAELAERTLGTPATLFAFALDDGHRALLPAFARPAGWLRRDFVSPGGGLPGGLLCDAPWTPARAEAVLRALAQIPDAAFHLSLDPEALPRLRPATERSEHRERFFVLDLRPGYDAVFRDAFAKDFREQCRKAERRGISVAVERGRQAFVEFGHLHRRASREWDAASRKPLAFFAAAAALAEPEGAPVRLALARSEQHDGAAVAGLLTADAGDTVCCWLAAMDRQARRLAPSAAVYRAAVEAACARGARRLLLGASGGIASVEAFKRSLGAEAREALVTLEVRGTAREWIRRTRAATLGARP